MTWVPVMPRGMEGIQFATIAYYRATVEQFDAREQANE